MRRPDLPCQLEKQRERESVDGPKGDVKDSLAASRSRRMAWRPEPTNKFISRFGEKRGVPSLLPVTQALLLMQWGHEGPPYCFGCLDKTSGPWRERLWGFFEGFRKALRLENVVNTMDEKSLLERVELLGKENSRLRGQIADKAALGA